MQISLRVVCVNTYGLYTCSYVFTHRLILSVSEMRNKSDRPNASTNKVAKRSDSSASSQPKTPKSKMQSWKRGGCRCLGVLVPNNIVVTLFYRVTEAPEPAATNRSVRGSILHYIYQNTLGQSLRSQTRRVTVSTQADCLKASTYLQMMTLLLILQRYLFHHFKKSQHLSTRLNESRVDDS